MGQAKRRSKKKREFKLPSFSLNKASFGVYKTHHQAKLALLKAKWLSLPKLHRRALAVLVPVVAILSVIPASDAPSTVNSGEPQRRDVELKLGGSQQELPPVSQRVEPASPKRPVASTTASVSEPASPAHQQPMAQEWYQYEVNKGETMANIFRDNSLPLADLYAVAAIEGKGKPLSRIKAGQWLRYKQTEDGGLDALQIESRSGEPVMFFRRSDGSFVRSQ
ncbi:LysM-like peptidoglycan-binding domain-containing protein [uncultured Photobacterium sp.]|uniref:LysM-like peptidoglycan-binding domain-containing protein n=1 Tax=uncultured Photobacterium sp. TaxID=173973 RepID=UPI0026189435|nr:LysM-like peptidoglycan-binding domain-containing protein [uncultured Photobacterium sp.]